MTYYLNVENDIIIGSSEYKSGGGILDIAVEKDIYNRYNAELQKYGRNILYIYNNGEIVINPKYEEIKAQEREDGFKSQFFNVANIGYYRKQPKGYQSAIESINTAQIICSKMNGLPANTLIFYPEPDFTKPEECTEEWLIAHQIKLPAMTAEQFDKLYIAFVTAWNNEEH